jgi:signal transduction histidine kinase
LIAIANQAERISTKDMSSRFTRRHRKDELGQVIYRLNEMLDRLELGFDTQRKFISHASHELKTPLTVIMGESELALKKERSVAEYVASLQVIANQGEKLTFILSGLIQLTEVSSVGSAYFEKVSFQVEELILEVQAELLQAKLGAERLHVEYGDAHEQHDDHALLANKEWLRIVLFNVLSNALKFSSNTPVHITTSYEVNDRGELNVKISVSDQGIGIPAGEVNYIKNPFFRGANAQHVTGSGIGLSIVQQIISLHSGHLDIQSKEGEGTMVVITLPLK